ncbi:MAG: type II secretion system ATPase GspE [Coprothermobacterota bacterium]|nr:type II secretion system ATPase GspE [Coprothermobacterota bacterium]
MPRKKIGEILVEMGFATPEQLQKAIEVAAATRTNRPAEKELLGKILINMGIISEDQLAQAVSAQWNIPYIDLLSANLNLEVARMVPEDLCRRYKVIPLERDGNRLVLAMADPLDVFSLDHIRLVTGYLIEPRVATESGISAGLDKLFGVDRTVKDALDQFAGSQISTEQKEEELSSDNLAAAADQAPIIRLVNMVITQAVREKATDIHIEPRKGDLAVRYRLDGLLHNVRFIPRNIQPAITSRIKIMAQMDIAERRLPQDGRIPLTVDGREIDLRVSTLPTIFGEKVVLRILDKSSTMLSLQALGFFPEAQSVFERVIHQPYGMILITGPTGSGKTTTLYAILRQLNSPDKNLITVEDPVEYQMTGVNQVMVNPKAGLTFANSLRSFLRQDPDIIMVGEIRDSQTAEIAINAALTGHLVLSTLHTNDASSAVTRLIDMGIEPFLIASSLIGVTAQRLVRKICPYCKLEYTPHPDSLKSLRTLGLEVPDGIEIKLYRGTGCEHCQGKGYTGRTALQEVMYVEEGLKELILQRASSSQLKEQAKKVGMQTLLEDGWFKVLEGITTMEEVLRVVATAQI